MRLSRALCTVVGEVLPGSHATLDTLFINSGASGEPPDLAHHSKWKEWLFRAGQDPTVDSLAVLGNVLEEFMDLAPTEGTPEYDDWKEKRERVERALEENGLRYYRFGRVLPQGDGQPLESLDTAAARQPGPTKPERVEELLEVMVRGLRRACTLSLIVGREPNRFPSATNTMSKTCCTLFCGRGSTTSGQRSSRQATPGRAPVWISFCRRTASSSRPR